MMEELYVSRHKRNGTKMIRNVENARLNHLVNKYAVKRNNEIVLDEKIGRAHV